MSHKFQINLGGIIELLSDHLYSGPDVYIRELLQNGVDAIQARGYLEPGHQGRIRLEVLGADGATPTLCVEDNGVGLTEEEVHQFLATIGQSSKRDQHWDRPTDFIGRFGIGLLSGFLVSHEIVVITRSARDGGRHPGVKWRGRQDGTYTVEPLEHDLDPGTRVYLTARSDKAEFFDPDKIAELAEHYGGLLPFPIEQARGEHTKRINDEGAPWRQSYPTREAREQALLDYGRRTFGTEFIDAIPLRSEAGDVDGVAFVLPFSPSLATKRTHRVYLKNMLLSEDAEGVLPDWAFFVKGVINANALKPLASREAFHDDEDLEKARESLGTALRDYLVRLSQRDPERLQRLLDLHDLSIKALAVQDDEFYRTFIDWITFETTHGRMPLGEYRKRNPILRYVPSIDQFRQIAPVAAAQGISVINAGYAYEQELIEKFPEILDGPIERVDPSGLAQQLDDLNDEEHEAAFDLLREADRALRPFQCAAEIKKFRPENLPALYSIDSSAEFYRSAQQAQDAANPLWGGLLDGFTAEAQSRAYSQLCLNWSNPLIRKLAGVPDKAALRRVIALLYVQALLMGHRPLRSKEMEVLNQGLIDLISWGLEGRGQAAP